MNIKVINSIKTHANLNTRREICGCVCYNDEDVYTVPFDNAIYNEILDRVYVPPEEYERVNKDHQIYQFYHSHIRDNEEFSEEDIRTADLWDIPISMYNVKSGGYKEYFPKDYKRELLGRRFIWGFNDCYSMGFDLLRQEFGILIPNPPRDAEIRKDSRFCFDLAKQIGAEFIKDPKQAKEGDFIISRNTFGNPNHVAVYFKGRFYEQRIGEFSATYPAHISPEDFVVILRHPAFI